MFGIGIWELVLIFVVALLVIGPEQLPSFAKKLANIFRQFKRASDELQYSLIDEADKIELNNLLDPQKNIEDISKKNNTNCVQKKEEQINNTSLEQSVIMADNNNKEERVSSNG